MKPVFRIMLPVYGLLATLLSPAYGQQTIFNVPSSDITSESKVFVQEQISFEKFYQSSTTVDYGLPKEWEVGVNVYNVYFSPEVKHFVRNDSTTEQPYGPMFMVNAQKAILLTKALKIGVGGQVGFNTSPAGRTRASYYAFTNLGGSFAENRHKVAAGIYAGNSFYLSDGPKVGFQAGTDAGIIHNKLHLLVEWMSGTHQYGKLIVGPQFYFSKNLSAAVGWQRNNKDGSQSLVAQLSYTPQE